MDREGTPRINQSNEKRSSIPWGLKVLIWKINFCSGVLRLSELPKCREGPEADTKTRFKAFKSQKYNRELSSFSKVRKSAHGTFYVYIVFLICFLPSNVLSFLLLSRSLNLISFYEAWLYVATSFFLNSSLNPVIYCWKMGPIRRTLMDIMRGIVNRFRE